jgi:hypothetical protein
MAEKKGSKNAIENRGAQSVMICTTCGETRKPFKMFDGGRARMAYECKCGLLDKAGTKI